MYGADERALPAAEESLRVAVSGSAAATSTAESDAAAAEYASRPPSQFRPILRVDAVREQQHIASSGVSRSHRDDALRSLCTPPPIA